MSVELRDLAWAKAALEWRARARRHDIGECPRDEQRLVPDIAEARRRARR
ncbi:hypothetical protein [Actinokineospora iranica]|nr:hypothetical protein [Actinokineospora iranica]